MSFQIHPKGQFGVRSVLAPFVAMPGAPSSFLLLVAMPGAPSSEHCS